MNYTVIYDLVKMSHNVYYDMDNKAWLNTSLHYRSDLSVNKDGIRSYLFSDDTNKNVVIAFKGTSVYWVTNNVVLRDDKDVCGLSSSVNDKYNDNLFFSCCFYKQSNLFGDCNICEEQGLNNLENTCCKNCYRMNLNNTQNYINELIEIIDNAKKIVDFENANVIFTGHSLGGMLASIVSLLYDKPAVSFETPGDIHYLQLVYNKSNNKIFHFGHNADPLYMGNCGNLCSFFGYNINTKCHSGYTCMYDSREKMGLSESILNHRIEYITKNIIPNWENDMPECIKDYNCTDCETWQYFSSNNKKSRTCS